LGSTNSRDSEENESHPRAEGRRGLATTRQPPATDDCRIIAQVGDLDAADPNPATTTRSETLPQTGASGSKPSKTHYREYLGEFFNSSSGRKDGSDAGLEFDRRKTSVRTREEFDRIGPKWPQTRSRPNPDQKALAKPSPAPPEKDPHVFPNDSGSLNCYRRAEKSTTTHFLGAMLIPRQGRRESTGRNASQFTFFFFLARIGIFTRGRAHSTKRISKDATHRKAATGPVAHENRYRRARVDCSGTAGFEKTDKRLGRRIEIQGCRGRLPTSARWKFGGGVVYVNPFPSSGGPTRIFTVLTVAFGRSPDVRFSCRKTI